MTEKRKFLKRKTTINSIRLSCAYRGVLDDPSMTLLNEVLEDYLKNFTFYIKNPTKNSFFVKMFVLNSIFFKAIFLRNGVGCGAGCADGEGGGA